MVVNVINFSESLEHDLKVLGAEVQEKQNASETAPIPERTVVHESIRSLAERVESAPSAEREPQLASPAPAPSPVAVALDSSLPAYLDSPAADPAVKRAVGDLVGLTFREGLMRALREARHQPPFIEDAFHDALVDTLLPELKRRGLMK